MTYGRIIKNGDKYKYIELSDSEQLEILDDLIQKNLALFAKIDKSVSDFLFERHILDPRGIQHEISLKIFEAMAIHSYTMLKIGLDKKIRNMKLCTT